MTNDRDLLPGRLLRQALPPEAVAGWPGLDIRDARFAAVLAPDAPLHQLYQFTLHGEGTIWDPVHERLLWSDVPNRRLLAWHPDGRVEVAIDATFFMNGNAIGADGVPVHCEHGRRCISRSSGDGSAGDGGAVPIVTHFDGRRLNSPNDVTVAADGAIWFTDPTFGILMPNQGSIVEPDLDHRSVYRFDPSDGGLRRMADFDQPNGIFFSPDGRICYVSDTARSLGEIIGAHAQDSHEIIAFDVAADGSLSGRRLFCVTDHGYPDGFAVDRRGWVWTTAGDGVHVYDDAGVKLGFIALPATPSNCCFGLADMSRFFVAGQKFLWAFDLKG